MELNLAMIQFAPTKGSVDVNLDRIAELLRQASDEKVDLAVFPESATSGYILEGGARDMALSQESLVEELSTRLSGHATPIDFVVGYYEQGPGQPYNSAAYLAWDGKVLSLVHNYRKFFLPTYGVFDEERFHAAGSGIGLAETRFGKVGILICEDVWHSILGTLLAVGGAELVVVPSASPLRGIAEEKPGNVQRYERMLRSLSEEHGVYAGASMLIGFEGGKGFSGGSMIFDPNGEQLLSAPFGEESIGIATLDLEQGSLARTRTPLTNDLRSRWREVLAVAKTVTPL